MPAPFAPAGESYLPSYRQRVQPPIHLLLARATTTTMIEAAFGPGMGAPDFFKREWRGFLTHKLHVANMDGHEVNFICLVCRGSSCRAVFSTSCRIRVLGRIECPCWSWREERARAWNLGGPLTFIGIKKQYDILDKHAYTYTHKHGNQQETVHTKGFLSMTTHRVCAWLCT